MFKDLTGKKFSRLTAIEYIGIIKGRQKWKCKCECGNEIITLGYSLETGNTKSCGCYHKERTAQCNFKDITGKKFNRLTVIERVKSINTRGIKWRCKCDCGNEKIILGSALVSENTKSCGCYHKEITRKDLIGKKFGRLTIIEGVGLDTHGDSIWRCICECGNEAIMKGYCLSSNLTKSCGCYAKEVTSNRMKKGYGESAFNGLYNSYERNAKKRGYEFALSKDEFKDLVLKNCAYCGKRPTQKQITRRGNGDFIYNGIDRVDSNKGYIKGNVKTCCVQCNFAKRKYSEDEFYAWIKAVYEKKFK